MKQKVQLRALRWVPERAGVPREGRGEAPVQHIPSQTQSQQPEARPFRRGERAPPRRPAAPPPPPRRPRPYALHFFHLAALDQNYLGKQEFAR